jgi:hypothetical protein
MRKDDARQLDHKTLEALRIRAVGRVQDGESPEVVGKALGLNRTTIYGCGLAMPHVLAGGNPVCVTANHRRSI